MENPASGGPFDRPLSQSSDSQSDSRPSSPEPEPAAAAHDLVADPSLTAASALPTGFAAGIQDPFQDLDFFTRKDIMKMAFESGVRFYQQLAIKDQKLATSEKLQASMELCLDHMVMNLSMYLNDTTMGVAFARAEQQLSHQEDPWTLSILRERYRAALMAAAMGGP
jgi:hypothetical protein